MKQGPNFSVIIPAANEERFIERAIRSVRAQSYPAREIIVVVNGLKDATAERAQSAGVRVLTYARPIGSSVARNAGAKIATGDTLVFLDADSEMEKDTLARLAAHAGQNVFGTVYGKPDNTRLKYRIFFTWKNTLHRLRLFRGVMGGLLFCNAALFKKVKGFDERLAVNELADFIVRATEHGGNYMYAHDARAQTSMRRFEKQGFVRPLLFWIFVRVMWVSRSKRMRVGRAYMLSHDQLFTSFHDFVHDVSSVLWSARRIVFSALGSTIGAVVGVVILAAVYRGPVAYIREVFAERLAYDASTPIIDLLMSTAAYLGAWTLLCFGIVTLIVCTIYTARRMSAIRDLLAEEMEFSAR